MDDRIAAYDRLIAALTDLEATADARAFALGVKVMAEDNPDHFCVPNRADEFGDPINPARDAINKMRAEIAHAIGTAREEIARHRVDFNLNPDRASHSYQD